MSKIYRQGDVIIQLLGSPMDTSSFVTKDDLILARGETTFHAHRITQGKAELQINALLGLMILKVISEQAVLSHEEHQEIILPMGEYIVRRQREFDWYTEEVRSVCD
mgnify:CR=1 FL=1